MENNNEYALISINTMYTDNVLNHLLLTSGLKYKEGLTLDIYLYNKKDYDRLKEIFCQTEYRYDLSSAFINAKNFFY